MFNVTVMMFRDMVESVMLLNDEDLSILGALGFRLRRRWRLTRRDDVLCSVELLNLLAESSSSESKKLVVSSSLLITVDELSKPAISGRE